MLRFRCACSWRWLAVVGGGWLAVTAAWGQRLQPLPEEVFGLPRHFEYFVRVKQFDFDERKLGNFESIPMHWVQVEGPGFPAFGEGVFDEQVGRTAPPSFRLHTPLESVAFEYQYPDLDVIPGADYLILGFARAEGVHSARAFLSAYFVDTFGERIPGSLTITELIRSSAGEAGAEPWQPFTVALRGDYPRANSLRLRVWLLQGHQWRDPPKGEIDPIIRQDINPTVWFDDISVFRQPRARFSFSERCGLLAPGERGALLFDIHNSTDQTLLAEMRVTDPLGEVVLAKNVPVSSHTTMPHRSPLPELDPGEYDAVLSLTNGEHPILERSFRFAVLGELGDGPSMRGDIGLDIGTQQLTDVDGIIDLVRELKCGLIRVGVPMVGPLDTQAKLDYFERLGTLVRELITYRVTVAAVLLSPNVTYAPNHATPTRQLLTRDPNWAERLSPILAQHMGGLIPAWQLGRERLEAHEDQWSDGELDKLREYLRRFVSMPEVVVTESVVHPKAPVHATTAYWVPPTLPTRALAAHLGEFGEQTVRTRWLTLAERPNRELSYHDRIADLTRRVIIGKSLAPDRLIVPAPLEPGRKSGTNIWQPREGYTALRTLFHYLAGKRGVGALELDNEGIALIFDGPYGSCVAVWTWQPTPHDIPIRMYLGDNPSVVDLWGRKRPLKVEDGKTILRLTPLPQILVDVDAPLALLQASFRMSPRFVQIHEADPHPIISFRNHYDGVLRGRLHFTAPPNWEITPNDVEFKALPGERYELPLNVIVPNRQVASRQQIDVKLTVVDPTQADLTFNVPLTVGLKDIVIEAQAHWEEGALVVQQTLINASDTAVNFATSCQVPLRPLKDNAFRRVPPGERQDRYYIFSDPQIRELAGETAHLRLREIGGRRELDQLVEIPKR